MLLVPTKARCNLKRVSCPTVLLLIIFAVATAWAGPIHDSPFGIGGVVAYGPGGHHSSLWGKGIQLNQLMYGNTVVPMLRGALVFSSGSFLGAHDNTSLWGAGGTLLVRGCADVNGDGKCNKGDYKGILMTGHFVGAKLVYREGKEVLEAKIVDQIDPELAGLLNLPDTVHTQELTLTLASLGGKKWLRYGVEGGMQRDCKVVPEAPSFLLLSGSLLCLGAMAFLLNQTSVSAKR